ncbi:hypothetical protein GALMADRAFT_252680 [Galerina marginata CBS 339.88]|uniref:Uncharacterized protein n=1 Tax=Galerina marginata (strain CBS 339.88) TaxID=685588 RepID=A0A067SNP0_GALM3|nr:hypothetical protein GALMADRAFT_252680 [Galerina marginata CBS 339.88]
MFSRSFILLVTIIITPVALSPVLASDTTSSSSTPNMGLERGLKDVIWSCLITASACALVTVRPNVPDRTENPGSRSATRRRLGVICWGLFAPEMLLLWSAKQWLGARRLMREYHDNGWTMAHGHFLQMGGFMLYEDEEPKGILTPERLRELLASGRVELPPVTEADIKDLGKRDVFFKAFAVVQTAWLVVQCVARAVSGLVVTQLELLTITVALAYGAMYFFWWDKPLDVRRPVPVFLLDETKEDKDSVLIKEDEAAESSGTAETPKPLSSPWLSVVSIVKHFHELTESQPGASGSVSPAQMSVPAFYSAPSDPDSTEDKTIKLRIASGIALMFVAIYSIGLVPGLLPFPTYGEALLWKLSSIVVAAATSTMLLELSGAYHLTLRQAVKRQLLDAYLVARVVLLVEALAALRDLPSTAYTAIAWTSYIPHV